MKKKSALCANGRLDLAMLVLTLGLFAIITFALTIPLNKILNDVVWSQTLWADVLLVLLDLVEILAYAVGASLILFAAFRPFSNFTVFPFTFHFHALEKEMATHSSVFAWRIPGTVEPGGLPSMGSHRVRHN